MTRTLRLGSALLWLILGFTWAQDAPPDRTLAENTARIHYQRPDGNYQGFTLHVWEDTTEEVTWASGLEISGQDDFGVYWDVGLQENAARLGFIVHQGDLKDPGPDQFINPSQTPEVWIVSGDETIHTAPPTGPPAEGTARVHYYRPDGDYDGFTLHVWEDTTEEVTWEAGLTPTGEDGFGVFWDVALADAAERLGFIIHRGDLKDPGPDQLLVLGEHGNEIWIVSGSATIHTTRPDILTAPAGDLRQARAHWLRPDLLVWDVGAVVSGSSFALHADPEAGLTLGDAAVEGGERFLLRYDERGLPEDLRAQYPHLAGAAAFRLTQLDARRVRDLLRGQLALSMTAGGRAMNATGVQIPFVLDSLYADAAADAPLGVIWDGDTPTLAVWAPTARNVRLHLYETSASETPATFDMAYDEGSGIWRVSGQPDWRGRFYLYEVTVYQPATGRVETNLVTDPYSVSLSTNSRRSQIVNLEDADLKPEGWDALEKHALASLQDITVYELHVRDFSAADERVPEGLRGTYLAFAEDGHGAAHLRALAEAGLTHLHLLPTFDIATINEDKSTWQDPGDLSQFPPDSQEQQLRTEAVRDTDAFNWGYDPFHYNVPEGSYATDPDGTARILEFRRMVQAVNDMGLRLVVDVVYNHTNAAGQSEKSVLDRIVPGYYHRLSEAGAVETSTCCPNTATEHAMMEKLMLESALLWATQYKVDGFRFDLMGHHTLDNMTRLRDLLDGLTLEQGGVDGRTIYVYGEGWDFGEVAQNARFVNASQTNLAGTGIGSFNDRLRDAVRGGGPFDSGAALLANQGFASGLYHLPNAQATGNREARRAELLRLSDLIRVGLAGNLAGYTFEDAAGETVAGADVDYNGSPAGYTASPLENIVYVSKHDNQTLWDILQYKLPRDLPLESRVRAHLVALSIPMMAQGIPFFHAGSDILRSKSFDRDSYDSGDHFNRLDFSYQTNNFGVGLPPARVNRENWQFMRPLLADPNLQPAPEDIRYAADVFQTLLRVRYSSPLFRLETAEAVQDKVRFLNTGPEQVPGVIVMLLDDRQGEAVDAEHDAVLVVINGGPQRQTFAVPDLAGLPLRLHPALRDSPDALVRTAAVYQHSQQVSVPGFTTAVFVAPQE